jgi:hypothetical protein
VSDIGDLTWPLYKKEGGENIIFKANETHTEPDDFRKEGIQVWIDTWEETLRSLEG